MLDHNNSIKPLTDYIPKECRKSVNEYATWSTRERITSESIVQKRALNAKRRRERDDQVEKRAAKETKREALRTLAAMKPVVEIPSARGTTALGTNASTTITTNTMNMRSVELYRAAAPIKLLADITLQEHQALAEKEFIAKLVRHTKVRSNVTPFRQSHALLAHRLAYDENGKEYMEVLPSDGVWKPVDILSANERVECREMFGRTVGDPGENPEEVLGRAQKRVRTLTSITND